ncbi:hypothetical protein LTR08_006621 [Meristemomyces frigidus]|nr:hypothetical protein LTR08_006621 [Meristemomyces frigidus]
MAPPSRVKTADEDELMLDAPSIKRPRRPQQQSRSSASNGATCPSAGNATLGVELKTSFPVARIKRIMQADEDVGKVAQVTPHVVSRALELFMIKIISASAVQARGGAQAAAAAGGAKGSKRVLSQHMKMAIQADQTFDFLETIANKVPDAPSRAKKEAAGSDSEETKPVKKRGRKKKDPANDA